MCRKESTLREKLEQLPKDLDETYDRILLRIMEEDADEAFAALQWLTYSERPLYLDELAEAVVLGPDKCSLNNRDRLLDPYEVLHICSSLVVLGNGDMQDTDEDDDQGKNGNEEDENVQARKIVSFAHFSVKEYLISERIRQGPASSFSVSASAAHAFIGQTCLSYLLNFDKNDSLPANPLDVFPLIKYSARYWHHHVSFATGYPAYSEKTVMLTLKLFHSNYVFLNWLQISNPDRRIGGDTPPSIAPPLYYASMLQLPTVVKALIEGGADVNEKGGYLCNALTAVLSSGSFNAAEDQRMVTALLLLDGGANIEAKDDQGITVLHGPAFRGEVALTRLLLDRGADIEAKSNWGGTALYGATVNKHEEVARLLLERGANIEAKAGTDGATALCTAARGGRREMVQLLLERGSNIEARDNKGRAALHMVTAGGNSDVMPLLLEKGADFTAKDDEGRTALHYATLGDRITLDDRKEVIQLLLEKGANLIAKDNSGQTALHWAVVALRKEVVQLLLDNGADVTAKDDSGRTALHYATLDDREIFDSRKTLDDKWFFNGAKEMVQQLLEKGADVTAKDDNGRTALHYATLGDGKTPDEKGFFDSRKEVVQLLLEKGADHTAKDNSGRVALHSATFDGSEELAQLLRRREGLELDTKDCGGKAPLSYAG
jgi:ankyrin repeat domain-containing protein 50